MLAASHAASQASFGPGGALGARLFALLASQAHLPAASRRVGTLGGVTLEALVFAKDALECGSDADVAALAALLLPPPGADGELDAAAALVHALVDAACAPARASAPAARAIAAGALEQHSGGEWLLHLPAALRTLRGALAAPPAPPAAQPQLDWRGAPPRVALMEPAWAWMLAPLLPPACQRAWRLLFSSEAHGASFSTLIGRSTGRGAVIVLIRDKGGALAAGFSDAPLVKRAAFFGGYSCLLAALLPTARVHKPSGNNEHYVWCADGFESVPNGIGFGGQVGHFGVFVSSELEQGHSRYSATYANKPVLGAGDAAGGFELDALEIWGVDADALAECDEAAARAVRKAAAGGSVLDRFAQDRSFLQTATGRGGASEGER